MPTTGLRRATLFAVAFTIAISTTIADAPTASGVPPPYVTLLFSRSQWAVQEGCTVPAGAITLERAVADLASRGWTATGSVVLSRIGSTSLRCTSAALYPTWTILEGLRADHGFQATSHTVTYPNMTQLTIERQTAESCNTVPTLANRGFTRAWGMFSYPNNKWTQTIQANVVSKCFAFARRYSPNNNRIGSLAAPWWSRVKSVNGGACNAAIAACYTMATRFRYASPLALAELVGVAPGEWAVAQFHKLVSGARLTGTSTWDCTSDDWRRHWTNKTEIYCWNDYQRILAGVPATAVVTDPATVARAWGANPYVLQQHP